MNGEPLPRCELCNRYVWKAGERLCIKHDMMAVLSAAPKKYAPLTPKSTRGMVTKHSYTTSRNDAIQEDK